MPDTPNSKSMSVVLIDCAPFAPSESDPPTTLDQRLEASLPDQPTSPTSMAAPASHANSPASLASSSAVRLRVDTSDTHQRLAAIAHRILKRGAYCSVEIGYCQAGHPSLEDAIQRAIGHGAKQIVIVPMHFSLLCPSACSCLAELSPDNLRERLAPIRSQHPATDIIYATPPFDQERLVELILSKVREYEPTNLRASACNLNDLGSGETATVREISGGTQFRSRMASLGFTPGALVKMIQNYGHGAVIVSLRGTRVALGRGEARKVGVSRDNHQGQPGY
jgi:ferrous iron transport protein A